MARVPINWLKKEIPCPLLEGKRPLWVDSIIAFIITILLIGFIVYIT
jgi:hypothetical protein